MESVRQAIRAAFRRYHGWRTESETNQPTETLRTGAHAKMSTIQSTLRAFTLALTILMLFATVASAQFGRGSARTWMNSARLVQIEKIQKELELSEDQVESLLDLESSDRPVAKTDDDSSTDKPKAERPNFREMSSEQRTAYFEKRRKASEERRSAAEEKLNEILLPHQVRRLEQIKIQLMGAQALQDEVVAKELNLDEETRDKMKEVARERMNEMRDIMREAFASGDREAIQETMGEMRASLEEAVFDAMTEEQRAKLDELKGPPISFTAESMMGEMFRGNRRRDAKGRRNANSDRK